jgi:pimeloyl-ACP methyl ester carboxylesterase
LRQIKQHLIPPAPPGGAGTRGHLEFDQDQIEPAAVVLQIVSEMTVQDMTSGRCDYQEVTIGPANLPGALAIPKAARGLVIFAHGSGSGRHSRRNVHVAEELFNSNFATLLFDLLTEVEAHRRDRVFDVDLLTSRVLDAVNWALEYPLTRRLPIGLFGASTGAAGALAAAAMRPDVICTIVSRGGRPDLADKELGHVRAPTLLIVGGADREVLRLNETAYQRLTCLKALEVVPGATHLFDEKGALDAVVRAAIRWFDLYLIPRSAVKASAAGRRLEGKASLLRGEQRKPQKDVS